MSGRKPNAGRALGAVAALGLVATIAMAGTAGDEPLPRAKPVPRLQAIPLPYDQATIERDGIELTRYHFAATLRRPFLFPVNGPSGRSLTRMGHPHATYSHSHHNSVWVAHHDVDGESFWADTGSGRIVTQWIAEYFDDRMLYMGLTYYGHPMSCAAGIATLKVYEEENLVARSKELGLILGAELEKLKRKYELVGDVRYIGLFSVIELVRNRLTREPLGSAEMNSIKNYLQQNGLTTFINRNMVFICPPLVIKEEELLGGLEIIEAAISMIS